MALTQLTSTPRQRCRFRLVVCLVGFLALWFAIQTGGDNETVIIVGAGWSGLGAAVELKAGKPFVLLEARNRVGGRSFVKRFWWRY